MGTAALELRARGKKRGLVEEREDSERSDVMISLWLELNSGAAGRKSEDAREEECEVARGLEERDVGTLLGRAWVSVVRGCEEGVTCILVCLGQE